MSLTTKIRRRLHRPQRWLRTRGRNRAIVLMYHGVGEVDIDPWGLFVSPDNFAEHLAVLSEFTTPMPLRDLAASCQLGSLPDRTTAVTIDDGYANILYRAAPLLDAAGVPATLFAVSDPLLDASEYWWDELARLVLTPGTLPDPLVLEALGRDSPVDFTVEVGRAADYTELQWRADASYRDGDAEPGPRMALYRRLWDRLMPLDHLHRRQALDELAELVADEGPARDSHRSMTLDELRKLDGDVVEVGGHTVTHPLLPGLDPDRRRSEITANKEQLEQLLERPIRTFSYPFGGHDDAAVDAVRDGGYTVAVTGRPETVLGGVDPLRIGRFDVKNWSGDEFQERLQRWHRFH